jgi:nucleotide-binding universal stress UspA family protein
MPDIPRILCPIDFSDASATTIDHAVVIAGWYDSAVIGLHVYTPMFLPVAATEVGGIPTEPNLDQMLAELRTKTTEAFSGATRAGLAIEAMVEIGTPATCIVDTAARRQASLVVIGTHGASGFQRLMLGSVTEKVVRRAPCPVLTIPPRTHATSRLPFKHVLCGVDFSQPSIAALHYAFSLAQEGDADLTIMHVFEWPEKDEAPYRGTFDMAAYRQEVEVQARGKLTGLVPEEIRQWCTPHLRFAHGKPYREILSTAVEDNADIIVIGVHGHNVVDRMLFGSTTNQVIRQATCPVLSLRE